MIARCRKWAPPNSWGSTTCSLLRPLRSDCRRYPLKASITQRAICRWPRINIDATATNIARNGNGALVRQGSILFQPLSERLALGNLVLRGPGIEGLRRPHAAIVFCPTEYGAVLIETSPKNFARHKITHASVWTRQTPANAATRQIRAKPGRTGPTPLVRWRSPVGLRA